MRSVFLKTLVEQAAVDPKVFLVTGDLGWSVLEPFASAYPDRFVNCGVAEQNLLGVATGLAKAGFTPFAYSIASFAAMRPYEMIRNGPVLHKLPVRIVGIGGGFAYGHAGPTHFAVEDLTIARAQAGLAVIAPADPGQTKSVMEALKGFPGPSYLRVGKGGNPVIAGLDGRFAFGRPEVVLEGKDVLFIATGAIAFSALEAAKSLQSSGISAACAVMAHLPFLPSPELVTLLGKYRAVVSVEEGYTSGGLGALVAEAIAASGSGTRLAMLGLREPVGDFIGSTAWIQEKVGLSVPAIVAAGRKVAGKS